MFNFHSIGGFLTKRVRVGLGASLPRVASLQHARKQTIRIHNSVRTPFTVHLRQPQSQQTVVLHSNSSSSPSVSTHKTLWGLYTSNKTGLINIRTSLLPHLSLSLYRTLSTTSHTCYAREALQMSGGESDFGFSLGEDSDLFVEEPKVGFFFYLSSDCSLVTKDIHRRRQLPKKLQHQKRHKQRRKQ